MTLLVTILLGAGALLIISALEDSPLVATFQSVISGTPITVKTQPTDQTSKGWTTPRPNQHYK